jgi:hypothetical protein
VTGTGAFGKGRVLGSVWNQKLLRADYYAKVVLACWAIDSAFLLPACLNSDGNISLKKLVTNIIIRLFRLQKSC